MQVSLDIPMAMDMDFHSLQLHLLLLLRKKLQLLKQSVRSVKLNLKLILKPTPGILPMDIMLLLFTRHQKLRLLRLKPLLSTTALSIHTPMDTMDTIKVDVPKIQILLGAKGTANPGTIDTLAKESVSQDLLGIMVWFCSVQNGLVYGHGWDCTESVASQDGYVAAMNYFKEHM